MNAMRKFALLLIPLLAIAVLQASAQSPKGKSPYKVVFDPKNDVEQLTRDPDGKEGIFIKVQFDPGSAHKTDSVFGDDTSKVPAALQMGNPSDLFLQVY